MTITGYCQWFAFCDRPAVGTVAHPALGEVETCQRCADKLGLIFTPKGKP